MIRIVCPRCRLVFMELGPAGEDGVACPRCGTRFQPDEEEIVDPEDD